MKPEDICPYCSTFSCVAETNLALKCGTAQAVLLEARAVAAESRLAAAEECLRHAARELVYVHMHEEVGGPDLVHTSEGDAVIALSEKLLGPMATWPEEPNAGQRAFLAGGKP